MVRDPALLSAPLTALIGPVAVYDALALAAPALAAWCTYLLCRELRTGSAAALAGGLLFGFTTYEATETLNHLNLALVFTLPLAGLLVARHLRGSLSDPTPPPRSALPATAPRAATRRPHGSRW